jgi:hypothetical protein
MRVFSVRDSLLVLYSYDGPMNQSQQCTSHRRLRGDVVLAFPIRDIFVAGVFQPPPPPGIIFGVSRS